MQGLGWAAQAGVVVDGVELGEPLDRRFDGLLDRDRIANITGDRQPFLSEIGCSLVGLIRVDIGDRDVRPFPCVGQGALAADAIGATGDQNNFAC
jgi:hypothetical protein